MSLPIKLALRVALGTGCAAAQPPGTRWTQGEFLRHNWFFRNMLRLLIPLGLLLSAGCSLLPEITCQPVLHNPFPQLSKVAVAPFFNLSEEPTVDGRRFALAYFNELQLVQGFEVIPVSQVERAMQDYNIPLNSPQEARRLAQILGVDALVVGAVTDYTPYYPPRCALHAEWYAANPNFHPIPPGYGLPWGTPEEKLIPAPLVFEAEMALAREQMKTQTPGYTPLARNPQAPAKQPATQQGEEPSGGEKDASGGGRKDGGVQSVAHDAATATTAQGGAIDPGAAAGPPPWPDARGFIPLPPGPSPSPGLPSQAPVVRHTRAYNGHDPEFTRALADYYVFRDDARFGGWQTYLERSDDFVRFCCHQHVAETLAGRGGAGETRVVWRWPAIR